MKIENFIRTWQSTILILLVGIALIIISFTGASLDFMKSHISWIREVGIAFLIASLVTYSYESRARQEFADATVNRVLEIVMGDIVDTKIWKEMREQILEKEGVRRNATVRFRLYRPGGMESGRCVLGVTLEYRLGCLRSRTRDLVVKHFVDSFMADPVLGLPRLDRVEIDGMTEPLPDVTAFEKTIAASRDKDPVLILVERREIVYFPGAYNFLMSELTELEQISLHEVPDDVKVTVNCFMKPLLLTVKNAIKLDRFLLPNQSIEVRFERKDQAALPLQQANV
jgi:hypothetical protein